MNEIMNINTVQQYNDYFGIETRHPLVSVIDGREAKPLRFCRKLYNLYAILLKDTDCGQLKYGRSIYDYQKRSDALSCPAKYWVRKTMDYYTNRKDGYWYSTPSFYEERHWPIS